MKKIILLFSFVLILSLNSIYSQTNSLSLNDSLIGFDEKALIESAPFRGITTNEMPFYLAIHKREFLKAKYNIKTIDLSESIYIQEAKTSSAVCINEDFEEAGLTSPVPSTINISTINGINGWSAYSGVLTSFTCLYPGCCAGAPNATKVIAPGPGGLIDSIIGPSYPIHSVFGDSLNVNGTAVNGFNCYGNWFVKLNNSIYNSGASRITKTFSITPSNAIFNFAFIGVAQGYHCCCDNGGIKVAFKNCFNALLPSVPQFSFAPICLPSSSCFSQSTISVFSSTVTGIWKYNKWAKSSIDLSPWMGTCITIEVTAVDCPYNGHVGYGYFDAQCAPSIPNNINSLSNYANYKVYPNPNTGNFNIDVSKEINNGEILLRNVLGQTVHRQNIKQGNNQVKTENLAKGIYNYSVMQNKVVVSVGKVVVE